MSSELLQNNLRQSVIVAWSGPFYTIPDGWQVCDGTHNTPDLRTRFVAGGGNAFPYNTTGGVSSHQHAVTKQEIKATGVAIRNADGESVDVVCPATVTTSPVGNTEMAEALPPYVWFYFITPSN